MADESELKELYEGIEASPEEMAVYRARLADKLENRPSLSPWRWSWVAGPIAAGLIVWALFVPTIPDLSQQSLDELQSLVASTPDRDDLDSMARQASTKGNELARYNATMLVCLTSANGEALPEAAQGAVSDPRAEFRAFYLEYLLDYADAYQLNSEKIEERMDAETNAICLDLYARLLDLADGPFGSTA